jgi:hypothetical protein
MGMRAAVAPKGAQMAAKDASLDIGIPNRTALVNTSTRKLDVSAIPRRRVAGGDTKMLSYTTAFVLRSQG